VKSSINFPMKPGVRALLVCLILCAPNVQADEWHFADVDRVVAVGDVHGAYDALVSTLQNAGVIDDDLAWSGGNTHLVSTGDLLDRGAESRRVMNLLMRLEREALQAGGRVHLLLGNHEVMNLIGDLRYVAVEEYAAFQDSESPEQRENGFQQFRRGMPEEADEVGLRAEFDRLAPPGYFGHRRAFARSGPYGAWLLEKPFMVVINDTAFAHGGAPSYLIDNGLAGVNGALKDDLAGYMQVAEALVEAQVLTPVDTFKQAPRKLQAMLDGGQLQGEAAEFAQQLIELAKSPLHGQPGPTWYRGNAQCHRFVESPQLSAALEKLGAKRIVIGHTTTITRQVQQRLNGRVIQIDTGMLNEVYGGSGNALVIEGGQASVVRQKGGARVLPLEHAMQVGYRNAAISEDIIEQVLEAGEITAVIAEGAEWQLVQVKNGNVTVLASFRALPGERGFVPELAAYRLDRLLQLGMVPVTVRKKIDGRWGTLQLLPGVTLTERERVAAGQGDEAICSVDRQIEAMLVFDALVHNVARSPSSMVYDREEWSLMLVDHENAFSTDESLPADLVNVGLIVSDEWRAALLTLSDKVLRKELGDALDKQRLRALGKRRDALISLGD